MDLLLQHPQAVVIGASSGGLFALQNILSTIPQNFPGSILIAQHRKSTPNDLLSGLLRKVCSLPVREAIDKIKIYPGHIYVAPANYHLLVEQDKTLSLSIDPRVSFARPSIDVLFESAAEVYRNCLVGVILTGSNHDGTKGMISIKKYGGKNIAQDPNTAEVAVMPQSVINAGVIDHILPLEKISACLVNYFHSINQFESDKLSEKK